MMFWDIFSFNGLNQFKFILTRLKTCGIVPPLFYVEGFMNLDRPNDLISTAEARKLLGVSTVKMSQLLRDGDIRFFTDPLDKRVKLISRSEVTALRVREKAA
jgi:hypothetical protein